MSSKQEIFGGHDDKNPTKLIMEKGHNVDPP